MLNMKPIRTLKEPFEEHMLYTEFIETAPWNQRAYAQSAVQFSGIGLQLIRIAAQASQDADCGGRLALHSLPQSEWFYRPYFDDLGIDPSEGLRYLKLSTERANILLRGDTA